MQYNAGGLLVNDIICINLKHRQDRKVRFKRDARKKGFPFTFLNPIHNKENPILGKWHAHINAWKTALKHYSFAKQNNGKNNTKNNNYNIVIFEDDIKILTKRLIVPKPPSQKWDMLYLGGNIQNAFDDEETNTSTVWKRVGCLMTHAYIINVTSAKDLIDKALKYLETFNNQIINNQIINNQIINIDDWLCQYYHNNAKVYITTPEYIIQRDGFSDNRMQFMTYNQQLTKTITLNPSDQKDQNPKDLNPKDQNPNNQTHINQLRKADCVIDENSQMVLKLPNYTDDELPHVTLITPTRNNKSGFYFVIRNFYKLNYPKEKLTWIIIDDSYDSSSDNSSDNSSIKSLIPGHDQRIKYITCKMQKGSFLSIAKKINMAMSYISNPNELIAHFFDDQYYHELSLLSRVKTLMAYKSQGVQCVGCTEFGLFDIVNNKSYVKYYPDSDSNKTILFCPSLCYDVSWWKERHFDENRYVMESFFFLKNRLDKVIEIPFAYILVQLAINTSNPSEADRYRTDTKRNEFPRNEKMTEKNPRDEKNPKDEKNVGFAKFADTNQLNFFDSWDTSTQNFVLLMKETL